MDFINSNNNNNNNNKNKIKIKTAGSSNNFAVELIEEIDKRTSAIFKEQLETSFPFQRIYMAIQRECTFIFEHILDRL